MPSRSRVLWEVPIQAVYSSALPRAIETASYVAGPHRVNVVTDPRLNEIHHGEGEGLSESELPDLDLYRRGGRDSAARPVPGGRPPAAGPPPGAPRLRRIPARAPARDAPRAGVAPLLVAWPPAWR